VAEKKHEETGLHGGNRMAKLAALTRHLSTFGFSGYAYNIPQALLTLAVSF